MTTKEALELLDSTMEKDIKSLTPKDRLNFGVNLREFVTPKIQRSTFEPTTDNSIEIAITYED